MENKNKRYSSGGGPLLIAGESPVTNNFIRLLACPNHSLIRLEIAGFATQVMLLIRYPISRYTVLVSSFANQTPLSSASFSIIVPSNDSPLPTPSFYIRMVKLAKYLSILVVVYHTFRRFSLLSGRDRSTGQHFNFERTLGTEE